jgi:hypothetical protein
MKTIVHGRPNQKFKSDLYWIVDRPDGGYISVFADKVSVEDGNLIFRVDGEESPTLAIAPKRWTIFYAASVMDGAPVSVDRWEQGDK